VASDINKPFGITIVTPKKAAQFIDCLPIRKFFGVGKVTEKKMHSLGIQTGSDLKRLTEEELTRNFGKVGRFYYYIVRGIDNRPVTTHRTRKSISQERTFSKDIDDRQEMLIILEELTQRLEGNLKKKQIKGRTINLKVKYFNFKNITRSITIPEPINDTTTIMKYARVLLDRTEAGKLKVRLLGIGLSNILHGM
jgi:DNA polymerase-4